jgi:hypothetical protein
MIESGPATSDALLVTVARRVDQACNRFEQAWRYRTPRIAEMLAPPPGREGESATCPSS